MSLLLMNPYPTTHTHNGSFAVKCTRAQTFRLASSYVMPCQSLAACVNWHCRNVEQEWLGVAECM
jgi:hypothetical protein